MSRTAQKGTKIESGSSRRLNDISKILTGRRRTGNDVKEKHGSLLLMMAMREREKERARPEMRK
jgi:hypothetical protein